MTNGHPLKAVWNLEEGDVFELTIDEKKHKSLLVVKKSLPNDEPVVCLAARAFNRYWAVSQFLPVLAVGKQYLVMRRRESGLQDSENCATHHFTCVALTDGRYDPASKEIAAAVGNVGWFHNDSVVDKNPYTVRVVKRMRQTWS